MNNVIDSVLNSLENRLDILLARAWASWYAFDHRTHRIAAAWAQQRVDDAEGELQQARLGLKLANAAEQRACDESERAFQRLRQTERREQMGM